MSELRVAVAQFDLRAESSFEGFIAHVRSLVTDAAQRHAEVLVLPELVTTGLLGTVTDHPVTTATVSGDYRSVFPSFTDELIDAYVDLAASHAITIVGGSHYRLAADGSLRNTCFLTHPDGRVEMQDKLHLTPPEHALGAAGGEDVLVTRLGPFTVGIQICADIEFPEVSRYLVGHGVDLILCPSLTWNRRGAQRVRIGAHARAMENQLYVVGSPLIGTSGLPEDHPLHGTGRGFVAGPIDRTVGSNDGVIAKDVNGAESILVVDLDRDLLTKSRAHPEPPGLSLRRPDLYDRLRNEDA